jgi:hypothetical protein
MTRNRATLWVVLYFALMSVSLCLAFVLACAAGIRGDYQICVTAVVLTASIVAGPFLPPLWDHGRRCRAGFLVGLVAILPAFVVGLVLEAALPRGEYVYFPVALVMSLAYLPPFAAVMGVLGARAFTTASPSASSPRTRRLLRVSLQALLVLALCSTGWVIKAAERYVDAGCRARRERFLSLAREGPADELAQYLDANPGLLTEKPTNGTTGRWALEEAARRQNRATIQVLEARGLSPGATEAILLGDEVLLKKALETSVQHDRIERRSEVLKAIVWEQKYELLPAALRFAQPGDTTKALGCAVLHGRADIAALLLEHGADPNERSGSGEATPLWRAAEAGNADVVRALLASGADPNIPDITGKTPAEIARSRGHAEVVEAIRSSRGVQPPEP